MSDVKVARRVKRDEFVIVASSFLDGVSKSDLSPTEMAVLCHLLSRIRLGTNVVPNFSGIEAAATIGVHVTSVSTAMTRLRKRQIVRDERVDGHRTIVVNPHLASRADKRSRQDLRNLSTMPQVAIAWLAGGR